MKIFSVRNALHSIYTNRDLLHSLVKRDIEARYRSSTLGQLWIIIFPLLMLGIYTFVFGSVFGSRWANSGDLTDFIPALYIGLILHAIFSETVGKATSLIVNNPNYVKKVIFPLELLPVVNLLSALFNAFVSFILLLLIILIFKRNLNLEIFFVPLVIIPLIFYAIGFAWLVAALGVFFRDLEQVIGLLLSMLLFLSPVFYASEMAPPLAQKLLMVNPLSYPIEEVRRIILLGEFPRLMPWLQNLAISTVIAWAGLWVFERSRPAFADVL